MSRAAVLVALLPGLAAAACPDGEDTEPFSLYHDGGMVSTVYREADGVTVVRATGSGGSINETVIDRGLLTVSHRSVFATITAEYEGDVDAIFAFEPGAEITLRVRETRDDSTWISFDTYRIGEVVPFAIGDCVYPDRGHQEFRPDGDGDAAAGQDLLFPRASASCWDAMSTAWTAHNRCRW